MLHGLSGTLVSEYFAEHMLADRFASRLGEGTRARGRSAFRRVAAACSTLGPASSVRTVFDVGAAALSSALGFRVSHMVPLPHGRITSARGGDAPALAALLESEGRDTTTPGMAANRRDSSATAAQAESAAERPAPIRLVMLVEPWGGNLDSAWRDSIRLGIVSNVRWCLLFNGRVVRLIDSRRSYGRDHLQFDLESCAEDDGSFAVLWAVLRAEALAEGSASGASLLDEVLAMSAKHAVGVCRSLRDGVREALQALMQGFVDARAFSAAASAAPTDVLPLFEQSLTIVYRVLFLLFAEARRLVPTWHDVYRDGYSIEALRDMAERRDRHAAAAGAWETLQAIWRLAHRGCRAGTLVVTPFNGRLFSPARTPLAESSRLDDDVARRTVVALSTEAARAAGNRSRISYRDLGVEQLGAVYEHVLDYAPRMVEAEGKEGVRVRLVAGSGRRKATGSFYTPQSLTSYLVRRTLYPLVKGASADDILRLRVLDPAMGSGAFLVAACHYLAAQYERALVAEGRLHSADVDDHDRAIFRRIIAQRCLFGVDLNPMAVQLARLSLWLATLAADCPLTFLDHHLAAGDSLAGASPIDVFRYPSHRGDPARDSVKEQLALFSPEQLRADMEHVLGERLRIGEEPGDTLAAVQDKERTLQRLARPDGGLASWRAAADLWCACWFWPGNEPPSGRRCSVGQPPPRGVYHELVNCLIGRRAMLPRSGIEALLQRARDVATSRAFFHWQIEFPEAFFDERGLPREEAGFDAVIGNPPWDMLRADAGVSNPPADKAYDRALIGFARGSGYYSARSDGHPNRFQLFVERAYRLTRRGGRIGLVVPWGLFADRGCSALRRLLFEGADMDSVAGFDNTRAIFPIHRSLRFAVFTATVGRSTERTLCRFGERDASALDGAPDVAGGGDDRPFYPIHLSPALLARLSGDDMAVPDIRSPADLDILVRAASAFPWLSAEDGWAARFGRELNASDDKQHFVERAGAGFLPVVEGKHLEPFVANIAAARFRIATATAARLLAANSSWRRRRLAYRDVASATNRTTLIAAMLPAGCVTTHTVFCLKSALDEDAQWFLCGVMNSYVANYLARLRVTSHVSAGIVERMPVPVASTVDGPGAEIAALARQLAARMQGACDDRLQALVARLYALTDADFSHVLCTFPLVNQERRDGAFEEFLKMRQG